MKMDEIKLLCIKNNIKLNSNKKQKKKDILINDLINK